MANIVYLEPGTSATQDISLYYGTSGGASSGTSVTTPIKFNPRSLKCASGQFGFTPAVMANAGRRVVFWVQFDALPSAGNTFTIGAVVANTGGSASLRGFVLDENGHAGITSGASTKFGTTVYSINTWYRVAVAYVITTTTNWSAKLFITSADDTTVVSPEVSATNADFTLNNANGDTWQFGGGGNIYYNSLYIDDGTTLDDPGDKRATKKRYNATSTNNWDSPTGTGTNRWDYVSDLPLSVSNYIRQAATSQQTEVFGIESASSGDVDVSAKTITGYMAWYDSSIDPYQRGDRDLITQKTSGTTTTFPGLSSCDTNDYVFVWFADQVGGSAPTVAKSAGTATIGTFNLLTTATSTVRLQCWYAKITTGGTYTLRFTHASSSAARVGICVRFPNIAGSTPLDKNPACTVDGTTAYDGPNSTTLSQADELCFGAFAFAGPSTDTVALGTQTPSDLSPTIVHNGGTTGGSASSNVNLYVYFAPVQATTAVAMQLTNSTSNRAGVQSLATYKATVNLFNGTPQLVSNGSDNSVTLTNSAAMYKVLTTTSTYPTGAFGMKSSGGMPTYLYEGGVIIGYDDVTISTGPVGRIIEIRQAVNRASTY